MLRWSNNISLVLRVGGFVSVNFEILFSVHLEVTILFLPNDYSLCVRIINSVFCSFGLGLKILAVIKTFCAFDWHDVRHI